MRPIANSQVRNFIISIVVCESKVTVDLGSASKKIQIIEAKTMNNDIINSIVDQCRCMIVMFDKTRYPTFLKAKKILSIVQSNNELNIVLINNKSDIENVNEVDESEVKKEIDKFKNLLDGRCVTLKIERKSVDGMVYGNHSDDGVDAYDYDYIYHNDQPKEDALLDMVKFFNFMIDSERQKAFPHAN